MKDAFGHGSAAHQSGTSRVATPFALAKANQNRLNEEVTRLGVALNSFPKDTMGLTPDAVKASPEYRSAKSAYNEAFHQLINFNSVFTKAFAKEIKKADRLSRRATP